MKVPEQKIVSHGININKYCEYVIDEPKNCELAPVLDIYVWDIPLLPFNDNKLIGIGTIQLGKIIDMYFKRRKNEYG